MIESEVYRIGHHNVSDPILPTIHVVEGFQIGTSWEETILDLNPNVEIS